MSAHSSEPPLSSPGDPVQRQLAAARRKQILDAAMGVIAEVGFHRATVKAIAGAAGIAEGTIYNYFATKTDLLFGLLDRLNESDERPAALAGLAEAGGGGLRDGLEQMVGHRLRHAGDYLPLLKALLPELLVNEPLRRRYHEEILAPTTALGEAAFAALVEAGELRPVDTAVAVRLVAGMVFGVLLLELLGDPLPAARRGELPEQIAALLLDGLAARREAG